MILLGFLAAVLVWVFDCPTSSGDLCTHSDHPSPEKKSATSEMSREKSE